MSNDIIAWKQARRLSPARGPTHRSPIRNLQSNKFVRGIVLSVALLAFWWYAPESSYTHSNYLPCRHLPGAQDTLVIMKTGVTELEDRLPPHLENTLRCPPNVVIYSDHEEANYRGGWQIRDVLKNINPRIQQFNDDFALWRRVKQIGRLGLGAEELTGTRTTSLTGSDDKLIVAGWVLDKWKFIAMMNETYIAYPNKKWYVFIESDTYLFWSTTLKYVSLLDHTKPHCLGHRTTHKSDYPFMQGGAGYVLSHAALQRAFYYIQSHTEELDHFLEVEWAGDIALGHVLNEAGVPLTYSWPIFQPSYYGVVDFGMMQDGRRYWCYPAASFHHVTPDAIEDLWAMEQKWLAEENSINNPYQVLRLSDVFNNVILPRIRLPKNDWDNQSKQVRKDITTLADCRQTCLDDETCLQFSFDHVADLCKTSNGPKYGEANMDSGIYSEWMFDRVEQWRNDQPTCVGEGFLYYGDVDEDL